MHWYVIKTKPKKEESAERQLAKANYEVFLPKIKGVVSHKPLFPSYLFIHTDFQNPDHFRLVRYTRGVSKVLSDTEGPQPVSDFIINTLRERTRDGSLIEQELLFKEGDEVSVKKGILKDLIGIIERNLSEIGRVKVLFKWLNGSVMRASLKYTELKKAA